MFIPCEHDPRGCLPCRIARKREYNKELYHKNKPKHKARSHEWHQVNKAKKAALARTWRKNHPERARELDSDMRFGQKRLKKMAADQRGLCGICRELLVGTPHTDHDPSRPCEPNVRTLLCDGCNPGLGSFKDSPELLREAANYVERHRIASGQLSFAFMLD